MLFTLSKVAWFLVQPSSLITISLLLGLAIVRRRPATGRRLLIFGMAATLVCGLLPLGDVLIAPLENRFARPDLSAPGTRVDGIIVLGGAEDDRSVAGRELMGLNEAAERLTESAVLARRFPDAKLVLSGGSGRLLGARGAGGIASAAALLEGLDIPRSRLILETASRNTYENATATRALILPPPGGRWLLVTSAWHMPRAIGCFRRAGFIVEPWPVDYRAGDTLAELNGSLPDGLKRIDFVVKEYLGLVAYRLLGRSDALFPAPERH